MEEEAVVMEVPRQGVATVRMTRSAACAGCGASGVCHASGIEAMVIEARDPLGVSPGQRVRLAVPPSAVLKASLVVYLVPILILLVVAAATQKLAAGFISPTYLPLAGVLCGLAVMAAAFILLRRTLRERAEESLKPVITDII